MSLEEVHSTILRATSTSTILHLSTRFWVKMEVSFDTDLNMMATLLSNRKKRVSPWVATVLWINMTPLKEIDWDKFITNKLSTNTYHGIILSAVGNSTRMSEWKQLLDTRDFQTVTSISRLGIDGGGFMISRGAGFKLSGPKFKINPKEVKFVVSNH